MLPDVLVLGAGGLLGEAWMTGVLAGLEEATGEDLRGCRSFVGTSAGAIVAASLAAGRRPRRPPGAWDAAAAPARGRATAAIAAFAGAATAVAPLGLAAAAPAGAWLRAAALRRMPDGRRRLDALRAEVRTWGADLGDGRLRVCTVERSSGRRVVFGSARAPQAEAGDAVAASCAIPGVFAPVRIGGREYVDGGAWSPVNADAAPAGRGDHVLVLEPMAVLLRGALRGSGLVEGLALRRRGARVDHVVPDARAAALMARLMDPDRDGEVLAAGFRQGLALGARD